MQEIELTVSGNDAPIPLAVESGKIIHDGGLPSGGTTGQVLTKASDADGDADWQTPSDGAVQDVQVNGVSVLSDGVANVPLASGSSDRTPGVVKINSNLGVSINNVGELSVQGPNDAQLKGGVYATRPITPYHQHASAFYGLAKAAGDSTQSSSSNAVGQYTDEAKAAIQSMIGVGGWEIIDTVDLAEETTSVVIDTDDSGHDFKLTEVAFVGQLKPSSTTTANANLYVRVDPYNYVANMSGVVRTTQTSVSGGITVITTAKSAEDATLVKNNLSAGSQTINWSGEIPTELHPYCEYFELYTTGTAKLGIGSQIVLMGKRA